MTNYEKIEKGLSLIVKVASAIVTIAGAIETIKPILEKTIVPLVKECKDYVELVNNDDDSDDSDNNLIDEQ